MPAETKKDVVESDTSTDTENKKTENKKTKKKSLLSRIWGAIFRRGGDDLEKRLKHISKEEATILARITRRSSFCRRITRQFILFSLLLEVIAVCYAIVTTRSLNLNWKMRAVRVLPMFLMPALCFITYSTFRSISRINDKKDQNTLEKLRGERKAKIDELKEKTNYYITQQLIQRYDDDPAAKAAAASVLASKLGADSGLKVYLGDDSNPNAPTGKSNDVELPSSSGLRNRKQPQSKTSTMEIGPVLPEEGMRGPHNGFDGADMSQQHQLVVEHHPQVATSLNDGGWIARLAALIVGEDPNHSYALICGNCHMHNGLSRKEDFPYVTYYCPHCNALNRPKQTDSDDLVSGSGSGSGLPAVKDSTNVDGAPVVKSPDGSLSAGSVADDTETSES